MNRSFLAALAVLTSLAPISFAQAQSHSHAGMPMQDHAAMPAASSANGVSTTPADNAMLAAAPTAFAVTFPHAMTLSSLKLTGSGGQGHPDRRGGRILFRRSAARFTARRFFRLSGVASRSRKVSVCGRSTARPGGNRRADQIFIRPRPRGPGKWMRRLSRVRTTISAST